VAEGVRVVADAPLSSAQRRLWFLHQLDPADPAYNISLAMGIDGSLNVSALRQAVSAIGARHEALRTVFAFDGHAPRRAVATRRPELTLVDVGPLVCGDDETLAKLLEPISARPFDLSSGPPARWTLLRADPARHVLQLVVHHIVFDGGSLAVLAADLGALYERFALQGEPSGLPEASVDDGRRADEGTDRSVVGADLAYWRRRLRDAPAQKPLFPAPSDPPAGTRRPHAAHITIDDQASSRALGRMAGASLNMVLTTAVIVVLCRYADQYELTVGLPISTRNELGDESAVGMFVNLLPLRVELSPEESPIKAVTRVRDAMLEAFDHSAVPFERLVEELRPEIGASVSPFFQTLIAHQSAPPLPSLDGLQTRLIPVASPSARYGLTVTLTELGASLRIDVEASPETCDHSAITNFAECLRTLLGEFAATHFQPIGAMRLSSAGERSAALTAGMGRTRPRRPGVGAHWSVLEQARRTPDAVAVVEPATGIQISYRRLAAWVGHLTAELAADGVTRESPVGVLLPRSPAVPAALLAVMQAGGVYVPLDPADPPDRRAWMIADAGIHQIVTTVSLADKLSGVPDARVLLIDSGLGHLPCGAPAPRPRLVHDEQAAYVLYTSGSTGRPKGVVVPHRGIVNRLQWMQEEYRLGRTDRVLHKTPLTFDVSLWELLWPLSVGACLVMAEPGGHSDARYLAGLMAEQQVTTTHFIPSMLPSFLDAVEDGGEPQALRLVVCSGESLGNGLRDRFRGLSRAELHNLYGPTEASIDVTAGRCGDDGPVDIGMPIANVGVHILDPAMEPVPAGVPGEICVAGAGLARGYLAMPGRTAEAFVPDPHGQRPGSRLYRTGDRGRRLGSGRIEFLGRGDLQVKIGGHRIEPAEIEHVLQAHPSVHEAAVIVCGEGDVRRLAAVVATRDAQSVELPEALFGFLRERLPAAMTPTTVVRVRALPRSPSGKLDRRALGQLAEVPGPDTPETMRRATNGARPPSGPTEVAIAKAWSETLGMADVDRHQRFFEVGGTSMLLVGLHRRLRQRVDHELTLVDLLRCPTVASLAEFIEGRADPHDLARQVSERAERRLRMRRPRA
jgi:amino acid adenylation domain-containing protein